MPGNYNFLNWNFFGPRKIHYRISGDAFEDATLGCGSF
jgi:hypothetical protein